LYDLDEGDYSPGAKWNLIKTKNDWFYAGLAGKVSLENEIALGVSASFNLGKLCEKINGGRPMKYLNHLEIGYYSVYDWGVSEFRDGLLLNLMKYEF
ncbi:MAG: hypothetical protein WC942_10030, partial [Clostridia bacterium]